MIDKFLIQKIKSIKKYFVFNALLALPLAVLAIAQALLISSVINRVFLKGLPIQSVLSPLGLLFMVLLLRPFFQGVFEWYNRKQTSAAKVTLRTELISMVEGLDDIEDDDQPISGLITTLATEGVESTDAYYAEFLPHLIFMLINATLILAYTLYLDWISGLIMMVTAPLIPVFMILIGKNAEGENQKQWLTLKRMNGHLLDLLKGMPTIRYFQKEKVQAQNVSRISEAYRKQTFNLMKITFLSALALELCTTISTAVIAVSLGLRLLYGELSFAPALAVLLLTPEFFQPLRQLGLKFHSSMNAKNISTEFKTLVATYTQKHTINIDNIISKHKDSGTENLTINDHTPVFELDNISFYYAQNMPVISNLSLIIPNRQIFGVVGKSGVGKTTLLKLLLGELTPKEGTIYFKDKHLSDYNESSLINNMTYMPQKSNLLSGTLLYNLKLDAPNINEEMITKYSKLTGLDAVINRLPLGLMTCVGEGFQPLSGGEKQLVALTRACLRETEVILLDEPTSALDKTSEQQVLMALKRISYMRTLVIATHNVTTLSLCHDTISLDGGAYENR